jgi:hypothetical protein
MFDRKNDIDLCTEEERRGPVYSALVANISERST